MSAVQSAASIYALQSAPSDPFARLVWLEQLYELVFRDAAKQFAQNQQSLQVQQQWQQQQQEWISRNTALCEDNMILSQDKETLMESLESLQREKDASAAKVATLEARITTPEAKNKKLKKELSEAKQGEFLMCENCDYQTFVPEYICPSCFTPAEDCTWDRSPRKKSKRVNYSGLHGPTTVDVSDSEGDVPRPSRVRGFKEEHWDRNVYSDTRLEEGAFEWLVDWCEEHVDRIEGQRDLERNQSGHEIRQSVEDLRDTDDALKNLYKQVSRVKRKRRTIKRKLLITTDEEALISGEWSFGGQEGLFVLFSDGVS